MAFFFVSTSFAGVRRECILKIMQHKDHETSQPNYKIKITTEKTMYTKFILNVNFRRNTNSL